MAGAESAIKGGIERGEIIPSDYHLGIDMGSSYGDSSGYFTGQMSEPQISGDSEHFTRQIVAPVIENKNIKSTFSVKKPNIPIISKSKFEILDLE